MFKIKFFIYLILIFSFLTNSLIAKKIEILYKVENHPITNKDVAKEINYLLMLNNQLKTIEKEELIQYGYQGFMRACQKYDEKKGAKISTYSSFWIRKYMDDYIKDKMKNDRIISLDNNLINILKQNK